MVLKEAFRYGSLRIHEYAGTSLETCTSGNAIFFGLGWKTWTSGVMALPPLNPAATDVFKERASEVPLKVLPLVGVAA